MKTILKSAVIVGIAGVLAVSAMTPSQARGRWVGPAAGFAAGAVVGAAAANAAAANSYYYGGGYYADDSYAYEPAYAEPTYVAPAPAYGYGYNSYNRYGYTGDTNYVGPWKERQLQGRD